MVGWEIWRTWGVEHPSDVWEQEAGSTAPAEPPDCETFQVRLVSKEKQKEQTVYIKVNGLV